jgi:hypothetical protein
MLRLRKTAEVMMVWATAATTLLGSAPHYDCRCPDGSIKSFCFGSSSESSCCCSGSCCSIKNCRNQTSGSKSATKPACCRKQSNSQGSSIASGSKPFDGITVGGTCCQKTPAQPEMQPSVRANTIVDEAPTAVFLHLSAKEIESHWNAAPNRTWQFHSLPPPTDLVTTLHRLTI